MSYCTNVGFIPKYWAYRKCFDAYYYIFYSIRKKNVFVFISVALDFTFILVSELQLNC